MKREIRHRAKHGYDATVARRGEKPRPRKRKAEKPLAPLDAPMDEPVVQEPEDESCGCRTTGHGDDFGLGIVLLAGLLLVRRRRFVE